MVGVASDDPNIPITWLAEPTPEDYAAAATYLSQIMPVSLARSIAEALTAPEAVAAFKAEDIIRASLLPVLKTKDRHVKGAIKKVKAGIPLVPILLVRPGEPGGRLIIADGYHRACVAYQIADDTPLPCRITSIPTGKGS